MSTEFGPVRKTTLADDLAQRVVRLIRNGTYKPGDRLPTISEMAQRFDVGHPTLREGLKKLEALGVVTIKHGSGVYVKRYQDVVLMVNPIYSGTASKQIMIDLIDARFPIELKTVVLAAQNATDENFKRMEELLADARRYIDDESRHTENDETLTWTNMAFHREVAVASGNLVLAQVMGVLTNLFEKEQRTILDIYGSRAEDHAEHLSILEALRARDASLAEKRMREHLEGVREVLLQWDPDEHPLS